MDYTISIFFNNGTKFQMNWVDHINEAPVGAPYVKVFLDENDMVISGHYSDPDCTNIMAAYTFNLFGPFTPIAIDTRTCHFILNKESEVYYWRQCGRSYDKEIRSVIDKFEITKRIDGQIAKKGIMLYANVLDEEAKYYELTNDHTLKDQINIVDYHVLHHLATFK